MPDDELFNDLPVQVRSQIFDAGGPRLREPVRDQIELRAVDLDRLIGPEHAARVIWEYVQGLDLGSLEQAVRAREHTPGQAPVSPRLMPVSYTHLRAHETRHDLVCRLLLEKKK